jgi:hypothetical protein
MLHHDPLVMARILMMLDFTSTMPESISISSFRSLSVITLIVPLVSVEMMGAWLFRISKDPEAPGTFTSFTLPSKSPFFRGNNFEFHNPAD